MNLVKHSAVLKFVICLVWGVAPLLFSDSADAQTSNYENIAVVGDSINTGRHATNSSALDPESFWETLYGKTRVAQSSSSNVTVLPPSKREFNDPLSWVVNSFMGAANSYYFNAYGSSWESKLFSVPDQNDQRAQILVAAKNGEKSYSAIFQVERVISSLSGGAPDALVVFFSSNDVCSSLKQFMTPPAEYAANIKKALAYFFRNSSPRIGDGRVFLISPINQLQAAKADSILAKEVEAFGKKRTCKDMRELRYRMPEGYQSSVAEAMMYANFLPPTPASICPSIFDKQVATPDLLSYVATTTKSYRLELEKLAREMKADLRNGMYPAFKGWGVHHISETADISFSADDIASDCMSLSDKGHTTVAQVVKSAIEAANADANSK